FGQRLQVKAENADVVSPVIFADESGERLVGHGRTYTRFEQHETVAAAIEVVPRAVACKEAVPVFEVIKGQIDLFLAGGIGRKVFEDARNREVDGVVDADGLTDRLAVPEIFLRDGSRDQRGMWVYQGRTGVTADKRIAEDAEETGFRECDAVGLLELFDLLCSRKRDEGVAIADETGRLFGERIVVTEGFSQRLGYAGEPGRSPFGVQLGDDTEDSVLVRVESIEAQLPGDEREDQDRGCDAEGQTDDIDPGIRFIADEGSPGYLEIIADHMERCYSVRRLLTGLATAARRDCIPTVVSAISSASSPPRAKTHHSMEIR